MTEIAFHFNVPDKLSYGCRLLRKAHLSGAKVVVTGPPKALAGLDQLLWRFAPTDFIPHCYVGAAADMVAMTPLLLADSLTDCPDADVLVNLGHDIPVDFQRFARFIEVLSQAEEDRLAARPRWKHYTDRGYAIKTHDLAPRQAAGA